MKLFKVLKWPIFGGAAFLLLCTVIFSAIRVFTSAPSKADCEIFRVLTAEIHASEYGYVEVFKPYVLPLNDPDFEDRISWVSAVSHRTDEKRTVPAGDGYDSYEVFVFEEVAVNLSSKNWAATLKDRKNLGKCFNRKTRPKISSLNLNALGLREAIKPGQTDAWPNIWQITEVIKSSDGHSAIVFTSSYCGGLCAWGGFYFFEKSNGNWKVIGTYTEWVA